MASTFDSFFERLSSTTPIQNQSQLAKELNVGRAAISLAKQKDTVPSKWILKLAKQYQLNSDWLASGTNYSSTKESSENTEKFALHIAHLKNKLDQHGKMVIDSENSLNLGKLSTGPDDTENDNKLIYLQMHGQSMEPEIRHGDYIIIDPNLTDIYAGSIYALAIDKQITVRRIEKGPQMTIIHCENDKYSSFQIQDKDMDNIMVMGRVINIIRKYI